MFFNMFFVIFFFFFKQKTAYEMRISDWSSDVCSSDLGPCATSHDALRGGICLSRRPFNLSNAIWRCEFEDYRPSNGPSPPVGPPTLGKRKWRSLRLPEIGRASCRERVCQYV